MSNLNVKPIHSMTRQELMCKQAKLRDEIRYHKEELRELQEELDYVDANLDKHSNQISFNFKGE